MEWVKAYRNLKFKNEVIYSLMGSDGRVKGYQPVVLLKDGVFTVRESGRLRVIREKQKNVHAFAEGHLVKTAPTRGWVAIRYNPYLFSTFVRADNEEPVASAAYIRLDANGAAAIDPRGFDGEKVKGRLFGRTGSMSPHLAAEVDLWNG